MAPQAVNLEPHREWIVSQIKAGATLEYIACHLPLDCPPVSAKLLSRRLDAWGVRNEATGRQGVRPRKRRDAGLEAARPWIVGLYQQMDKIATIRGKIKERTGIEVSKQRLHALLHDDWNVPPRRERAAAPDVQDFITKQAGLGAPVSKIQGGLQDELQLRVTTRWIYLKMHEWGIELPGHQLESMPAPVLTSIKQYIEVTFYESRHTDANMKQQLEAKGYSISLLKIFKLRMEMGLRRRHDAAQVEECLDRLRNAMWSSPRAGVLFPRLTKKMLPIFCRQTFHIPVSRGMAWKFLQEEYPEEMLTRVRTIARKRGGFLCPGPNYIWSIDAYCKLAHWGIEVYACIDAYSRYIVWGHVGHTAQTQRSVCLQYTDTVRTLGYLPLIMRSDHGVETGMIAGAHYWLSAASKEPRLLKPTRNDRGQVVWIYREVVDGEEVRHEVPADPEQGVAYPKFGPERNLEFKDCYSYGLSTKNQRIESWWSELNFHVTLFWRNFLHVLECEQEWSEHRIADRVALLYTYIPQVNWEIGSFIAMWNAHTIRAQRNRPHVVAGIPLDNYHGDDTEKRVNCSVAVNKDALGKLEEALELDRSNVLDILPSDIMALCNAIMETLDANALPAPDNNWPYIMQYRHLRAGLQRHEDTGEAPLLRLAAKPTGGWPALDAVVRETGRSLQDILGEDISDCFDPAVDE